MTQQRRAIEDAFAHASRPLSPTEVHAIALRKIRNLGLSTVYRTLRRLEQEGVIVPITVPDEPPRYEPANVAERHHHHFHCRKCGRMFDIQGCPTGLARLAPRGFIVEDHTVVLHGRCPECA